MVAYEILHASKAKRKGKQGHVMIKLDMSKAYDRVEWGFVEAMIKKLGINERWIHLILHCVSTVQYRMVLNMNVSELFSSKRGL